MNEIQKNFHPKIKQVHSSSLFSFILVPFSTLCTALEFPAVPLGLAVAGRQRGENPDVFCRSPLGWVRYRRRLPRVAATELGSGPLRRCGFVLLLELVCGSVSSRKVGNPGRSWKIPRAFELRGGGTSLFVSQSAFIPSFHPYQRKKGEPGRGEVLFVLVRTLLGVIQLASSNYCGVYL